jgi:hypothetical protein
MNRLSRRDRHQNTEVEVVEHPEEPDRFQDPQDFLDRHHPENDAYMRGIEHVQGKIMYLTTMLRPKQVNLLKSVFAGENYVQVGKRHGSSPQTVSAVAKSKYGQQMLNMLQYHRQLVEGPNEAMRRNMLWRIAQDSEMWDKKTSIKAIAELNKMHTQTLMLENPNAGGQQAPAQVVININQELMPRGALDR